MATRRIAEYEHVPAWKFWWGVVAAIAFCLACWYTVGWLLTRVVF